MEMPPAFVNRVYRNA